MVDIKFNTIYSFAILLDTLPFFIFFISFYNVITTHLPRRIRNYNPPSREKKYFPFLLHRLCQPTPSFVAHIILNFYSPPSLPLHFFFLLYQNKLSHNVFFDKNRFPKAFLKTLYCIHFLVLLKRKAKTSISNPSSPSSPQARTKERQKKAFANFFSYSSLLCDIC